MSGPLNEYVSGHKHEHLSGHSDVSVGFPEQAPGAGGLHAEWYEANVAAGRVTAQQCAGCGEWRQPARYRCATCLSAEWTFEPVSELATVISWTVTHRPFHFGFADVVPYALLIVATPEGPRYLVNARPCVAALTKSAGQPFDGDALIGDSVTLSVDSFGVPFAVLGPAPA